MALVLLNALAMMRLSLTLVVPTGEVDDLIRALRPLMLQAQTHYRCIRTTVSTDLLNPDTIYYFEEYAAELDLRGAMSADRLLLLAGIMEAATTQPAFHVEYVYQSSGLDYAEYALLDQAMPMPQSELQMRHSQKLESIGTLVGGVAHEINNPILGIMGYAQIIQDWAPTETPASRCATEIKKEAGRVATIVRNLLSFARVEKQVEKELTQIRQIVEGLLPLLRTILRYDQIELRLDMAPDLPSVACRGQQIQQVVMNLVTNARDALTEKYEGTDEMKVIRIAGHLIEDEERRWLRLTVEDHGLGIPNDVRERIFEPFYTTKEHGKGTGLGLAVSYSIVKDHQGRLTVESELGEWTRFHMDLPVE